MSVKKIDISQIQYTPKEGEVVQDSVSGDYAMWHDGAWQIIKMEGGGIELGIYDINKQIIAQLPDLIDWDKVETTLNNFETDWNNEYYMLYGKEISYFTLFKIKEATAFGREVIEVVKNIGPVKAMDLTETADAIEVWVIYKDEPTCLYLFPYDMGIVQVG